MNQEHRLREPCNVCSSVYGYIEEKGNQDVVRCSECNAYQYNAPRKETGKPKRSTDTKRDGFKASQRSRIIERDNSRCVICGSHATDSELHIGHIISVADGLQQGLTEAELMDDENLATHCARCNLGQSDRTYPLRFAVGIVMARLRGKNA